MKTLHLIALLTTLCGPVRATTLPMEFDGRARAHCVLVAPGIAVSVAHVADQSRNKLILVRGYPAILESIIGRVSVWKVTANETTISQIAPSIPDRWSIVEHRYWSKKLNIPMFRRLYWLEPDYIHGRFRKGMSGSGVYNEDGELIGLINKGDSFMGMVVPCDEIHRAIKSNK